jgi:crossover junction endodeoxyribonuclease RusA
VNVSARIRSAAAEQWSRPEAASVVLRLPRPPSVNALWTRGRDGSVHCTPRYSSWKRAAGNVLNAQRPGRISGPYSLQILVGTDCKCDLGNLEKAASDLLQAHGVIENDRKASRIVLEWSETIDGVELVLFPFQGGRR